MPDIATLAPEPGGVNVGAVLGAAALENKDKLMLVVVERAPPALAFDPNTEVFELVIYVSAGDQQLFGMAPIHADVVQRAVEAEGGEIAENLAEKGGEFDLVHLARGHREGAMMDRRRSTPVTVDRYVAKRIAKHHGCAFLAHQRRKGGGVEGVAA